MYKWYNNKAANIYRSVLLSPKWFTKIFTQKCPILIIARCPGFTGDCRAPIFTGRSDFSLALPSGGSSVPSTMLQKR